MSPDLYPSGKTGNPGSWNRYAYVLGDPVNGRDPRGLEGDFEICGADQYAPDCEEGASDPGFGSEYFCTGDLCVSSGLGYNYCTDFDEGGQPELTP